MFSINYYVNLIYFRYCFRHLTTPAPANKSTADNPYALYDGFVNGNHSFRPPAYDAIHLYLHDLHVPLTHSQIDWSAAHTAYIVGNHLLIVIPYPALSYQFMSMAQSPVTELQSNHGFFHQILSVRYSVCIPRRHPSVKRSSVVSSDRKSVHDMSTDTYSTSLVRCMRDTAGWLSAPDTEHWRLTYKVRQNVSVVCYDVVSGHQPQYSYY